jgi:hypothetical protein
MPKVPEMNKPMPPRRDTLIVCSGGKPLTESDKQALEQFIEHRKEQAAKRKHSHICKVKLCPRYTMNCWLHNPHNIWSSLCQHMYASGDCPNDSCSHYKPKENAHA